MNVQSSAVTITRRAVPKCSSVTSLSDSPASSAITVPPQNAARSPRCWMRRCPKPGRAHRDGLERPVLRVGHEHARARSASRVLGTGSRSAAGRATARRGSAAGRSGASSGLFVMKTNGFSKTVSIRCGSRTMYGESQPFSTTMPSTKSHADAGLVGLLDRHDALGADVRQRLGDDAADDLVLLGGDRRHLDELRRPRPCRATRCSSATTAAVASSMPRSQQHRVGALVERAHALAHDRLSEQRRRRGAVARLVGGLVGDLADELRAHVLVLVGELDLARDRHPVVGDRRERRRGAPARRCAPSGPGSP